MAAGRHRMKWHSATRQGHNRRDRRGDDEQAKPDEQKQAETTEDKPGKNQAQKLARRREAATGSNKEHQRRGGQQPKRKEVAISSVVDEPGVCTTVRACRCSTHGARTQSAVTCVACTQVVFYEAASSHTTTSGARRHEAKVLIFVVVLRVCLNHLSENDDEDN